MRRAKGVVKAPILLLWAVLLSLFTAVLGAAPLRVLRQAVGSASFWMLCITAVVSLILLGAHAFAFVFGVHTLLVGLNAEFEERDFTFRQSAGFSILITALLISSGFYTWSAWVGKGWLAQIINAVAGVLDKIASLNIDVFGAIKAEDIVVQLPSLVFIFLIFSLGLAFIFERPLARWAGVRMHYRERLSDFSVPEPIVWFFIFSLLGAFAQLGSKGIEGISLNVLNVTVVLYFFQGLAVLGKYFEVFKIGFFWRFLWVMLLVVQLPILMGLLGLVDYWADFRKAFVKKAAELKKKGIQE